MKCSFLWSLLFSSFLVYGPSVRAADVEFPLTFCEDIKNQSTPGWSSSILSAYDIAIKVVKSLPPTSGQSLFDWSPDAHSVIAEISFMVCDSRTDQMKKNLQPFSQVKGTEILFMDAFTQLFVDKDNKHFVIQVVFLWDRIFLDNEGKERPGSTARLIAALAHEVYGNVSYYLFQLSPEALFDIRDSSIDKDQLRLDMEVHAFEQGVSFLQRLLSGKMFEVSLTPGQQKFKDDIATTLKREQEGLEMWKNLRSDQ